MKILDMAYKYHLNLNNQKTKKIKLKNNKK